MIGSIIEGIVVAVTVTLAGAGFKKILDRKSRRSLIHKGHLVSDYFFHSQTTVNTLLKSEPETPDISDEFIDYTIVKRNGYYRKEHRIFKLKIDGKVIAVEVPYMELVDFVRHSSIIRADSSDYDRQFELPEGLRLKTQDSFDRFKATRILNTNDLTVRVSGFYRIPGTENEYICKVQRSTYYDQVHTNLTLDRLFSGIEEDSVRLLDLAPDNSLRPFEESIMANTIGVSAIWVMADRGKSSRENKLRYFLMPRSNKTGIYSGMLSSVGGVARVSEDKEFKYEFLEEFAKEEMKREFTEESGIDNLIISGKLKESDIEIIPLAFTRDLNRGGKPQFFFLISTPVISKRNLMKAFRNSFNGTEEFNQSTLRRMRKMYVSPETYCNLLYALEWIQRKKKTDFIDLD